MESAGYAPNFRSWQIMCSDGIRHNISIERGTNSGFPFKLYIDSQMVDTIKSARKGAVVFVEHKFKCGGDEIIFLFHAGKLDLVHEGKLVKAKIPYNPTERLPLFWTVIMMALSVLSLLAFLRTDFGELSVKCSFVMAAFFAICNTLLVWKNATSPFYTMKKKWLFSVLQVFYCVVLVVFFSTSDIIYRIILNL